MKQFPWLITTIWFPWRCPRCGWWALTWRDYCEHVDAHEAEDADEERPITAPSKAQRPITGGR
jgi:hypothetical protein